MAYVPEGHVPIPGSERGKATDAILLGRENAQETITVTIVTRRNANASSILSAAALNSTRRPAPLGETEFARQFGADDADLQAVAAFATASGLTVDEVNAARRSVVVSGTVDAMNKAFGVDLGRYRRPALAGSSTAEEQYRGREGEIHVPAALAEIITGVFGLDNRRITARNAGDPVRASSLTIPQVAGLYDFPSNSAKGQTIAIFSEGGYLKSDIAQFFSTLPAGFPMPSIYEVPVKAANRPVPDIETTQDICVAASAAPGADIAVYFTTYDQQGWIQLVQRVVHPNPGDPVCSVLSCSFYISDGDDDATLALRGLSKAWIAAMTDVFQDAAIQGVTVCIASGDTGSDSKVRDGKAHVQYPASDPWVLSVGGTTIGNIRGSAFDEFVWNDISFNGVAGATGGGVSDRFAVPGYQASAQVPPSINDNTHRGRGVPDVAANASPHSGYPIIFRGRRAIAAGTSASAPLWAGLVARINASLGVRVGFINPALYKLGSAPFGPITSALGATDNGVNGIAGYPLGKGWNACTGWGSPRGNKLLVGLASEVLGIARANAIAASIGASEVTAKPAARDRVRRERKRFVPITLSFIAVAIAVLGAYSGWSQHIGALFSWLLEMLAMAACLISLGLLRTGLWFGILVDGRNKISLSRTQLIAWTLLFAAAFLSLYCWNLALVGTIPSHSDLTTAMSMEVPDTVWLLMGISGITAAATPLILSAKPQPDPSAGAMPSPSDPEKTIDGMVVKRIPGATPQWSDIVLGDDAGNADVIDISKVQQLLLSLVAIAVYGFSVGGMMLDAAPGTMISKLPALAGGFLALIAASDSTYLAYKAVPHSN